MEAKIPVLINEIDKLNKILVEKSQENEQLRTKNFEFDNNYHSKDNEANYYKQRYNELEHWKISNDEYLAKLRLRLAELED